MNAQTWQTVFFDNFNRADGVLGSNYNTTLSPQITQLSILGNEVKIASGPVAPAYWIVSYLTGINYDSIRISCKYKTSNSGCGFSINARDNGVNTFSAGIMANTDTIAIYKRDYIGNSITLAKGKAFLAINKTYFLEFTLKSADLALRFVEVGMTDTITLLATDNSLTGNNINLSSYFFTSNVSIYFDDFKIEAYSNATGIDNVEKKSCSLFPTPASDFVTLSIDKNNIEPLSLNIYNIMGSLVKSKVFIQNQQQIDVSDLSNGIYMAEIKYQKRIETQKLIIQR